MEDIFLLIFKISPKDNCLFKANDQLCVWGVVICKSKIIKITAQEVGRCTVVIVLGCMETGKCDLKAD